MIKKPLSYAETAARAEASAWWLFVPEFLRQIADTVSTIKRKLQDNEKFNTVDLLSLRDLYRKFSAMTEANKKATNTSGITDEKALVKQMFELINSYFEKTQIAAGIQKRLTKVYGGGTVDNYYYKVGDWKEYSLLRF